MRLGRGFVPDLQPACRVTYLGVLEQLGEVDSLRVQDKLLLILTVDRFVQETPSDALGRIDNGIVGQGYNQGAHVKINLHQWELHCHLREKESWAKEDDSPQAPSSMNRAWACRPTSSSLQSPLQRPLVWEMGHTAEVGRWTEHWVV